MRTIKLLVLVLMFGFGVKAIAAIFIQSPSSCTSTTWMNCQNSFSSNDVRSLGAAPASGVWGDYNFNFGTTTSTSTASTTVQIGVEAKASSCLNSAQMSVAISKNGGASYGTDHSLTLTCAESTNWVDVTADFPSWSTSDFSNSNLKVRAKCDQGSYCKLDWLPVEVDIP